MNLNSNSPRNQGSVLLVAIGTVVVLGIILAALVVHTALEQRETGR